MSQPTQSFVRNHLLLAMAGEDYALLRPHLEAVVLNKGDVLIAPNQPINHVYFPENALASIIAISPEGQRIEAGLYGRDGMSGASLVHDSDQTPLEHFIQIADGGYRVTSDRLRSATAQSPSLLALLLRYSEALSIQTAQTALSNAAHTIDERLARWLLMCHDRIDGNELRLTHEFLSLMLGVRRAGVTTALHVLEGGRMVTAVRSSITIQDRAKLETFAADAYGVPEAAYRRLVGAMPTKH